MKELIINSFKSHKYFIGISQLCRFLNNKGYIRYGCNAKYIDNPNINKKKTIKINPCKKLCKNSNIYKSKLSYWINKLSYSKEIFSILIMYKDSRNPNVKTIEHKTFDIFRFISENIDIYIDFKSKNEVIEL